MIRVAVIVIAALVATGPLGAQGAPAEEARLQGVWTVTAAEQRGRPFDVIKGGVLTIAERVFVLRTAAGNEFKGVLRLNPSASPKQLDFVHDNDGPVWEAIYSVSEDVLRLNYVEADGREKRPALFATSSDSPGTVIVMRRVSTLTGTAQ
jgi:uncharacterized protein (TIGR03067 family)